MKYSTGHEEQYLDELRINTAIQRLAHQSPRARCTKALTSQRSRAPKAVGLHVRVGLPLIARQAKTHYDTLA